VSRKQIERVDEKLESEHEEQQSARDGRDQSGAVLLVLPPPSEPMAVAREFVESWFRHDDMLTLRYWRGGWWRWQTTHWIEVDGQTVRSALYRYTEHAIYVSGNTVERRSPNRHKVGDLIDALAAICILPHRYRSAILA